MLTDFYNMQGTNYLHLNPIVSEIPYSLTKKAASAFFSRGSFLFIQSNDNYPNKIKIAVLMGTAR